MNLIALVGWDPVLTGYLAVLLAILVLCGSVYMVLATNLGLRLGFLVAWTGLWAWMLLMGIVWWFFGIGWVGHGPTWEVTHVSTNPEAVPIELVQELSNDVDTTPGSGWEVVIEADARATADAAVVCNDADPRRLETVNTCLFSAATDYQVHRVMRIGGERYRPLGLPDNAVTQYFIPSRGRPHYAVVQLQPYKPTPDIDPNKLDVDGKVLLPEAVLDDAAPIYTVVMVRDQGNLRLRPALFAIFSGLLFGLGCYHLHRRDQAIWAVREAAGTE
ncbi:MAG: hypothetical protein QF637_13340 [Acidimicrobiales bacterium]|nr:hypothetical protein [Acidimicrobiales bacterium]